MKNLPKYMLFWSQGANIKRKSSFKTKAKQKDWQKLSFPTPIWENLNNENKPPKNII